MPLGPWDSIKWSKLTLPKINMSSEKGPFQKEIILTTQHFSRAVSCSGRVLYPLHGSKFRPSNQPERRNAAKPPTDLWAMVEHVTGHPPGPSNDGSLAYRALEQNWGKEPKPNIQAVFFTHSKSDLFQKLIIFRIFRLRLVMNFTEPVLLMDLFRIYIYNYFFPTNNTKSTWFFLLQELHGGSVTGTFFEIWKVQKRRRQWRNPTGGERLVPWLNSEWLVVRDWCRDFESFSFCRFL